MFEIWCPAVSLFHCLDKTNIQFFDHHSWTFFECFATILDSSSPFWDIVESDE